MLKDKRNETGLSQAKLAEKSGVNKRMIEYYEQGSKDINGAHLSTLVDLAVTLECPIAELLSDKELIEKLKKTTLI